MLHTSHSAGLPPEEAAQVLHFPHFCLVLLIGPAGSGKSTLANRCFKATEVVSSDHCRAMICDSEADQTVSSHAFELLHQWVKKRLQFGRRVVVDATNTTVEARVPLLKLASKYGATPIALTLDLPPDQVKRWNRERHRHVPENVIEDQYSEIQASLPGLKEEGFSQIHVLRTTAETASLRIQFLKAKPDKRHLKGPFNIIGDVHGCFDELIALLQKLGYYIDFVGPSIQEAIQFRVNHPQNRQLLFLGDLCDRGPKNHRVLRLVMDLVDQGTAMSLKGNHEMRLRRHMETGRIPPTHGLDRTLEDLDLESDYFRKRVLRFIHQSHYHLVLDEGKLVVAHAGLVETYQGYEGSQGKSFALYGDVRKGKDAYGFPIRGDWAATYLGKAKVVYGHTPVLNAVWRFGTLCIDTGCVYGGKLTALSYPEGDITQIQAAKIYCDLAKPLGLLSEALPI